MCGAGESAGHMRHVRGRGSRAQLRGEDVCQWCPTEWRLVGGAGARMFVVAEPNLLYTFCYESCSCDNEPTLLTVNEVLHKPDTDGSDFIEIVNMGSAAVDLSGIRVADEDLTQDGEESGSCKDSDCYELGKDPGCR
ncbi:hypothetical protein CYMTET_25127, partial [Cymbomonas tetramitiformis]